MDMNSALQIKESKLVKLEATLKEKEEALSLQRRDQSILAEQLNSQRNTLLAKEAELRKSSEALLQKENRINEQEKNLLVREGAMSGEKAEALADAKRLCKVLEDKNAFVAKEEERLRKVEQDLAAQKTALDSDRATFTAWAEEVSQKSQEVQRKEAELRQALADLQVREDAVKRTAQQQQEKALWLASKEANLIGYKERLQSEEGRIIALSEKNKIPFERVVL